MRNCKTLLLAHSFLNFHDQIFILLPVSSYLCSNLPRTYMFLIIPQWPSFFLYDASSYFSRVMFLFYNPGGPNFLRRERQDTAYPVK